MLHCVPPAAPRLQNELQTSLRETATNVLRSTGEQVNAAVAWALSRSTSALSAAAGAAESSQRARVDSAVQVALTSALGNSGPLGAAAAAEEAASLASAVSGGAGSAATLAALTTRLQVQVSNAMAVALNASLASLQVRKKAYAGGAGSTTLLLDAVQSIIGLDSDLVGAAEAVNVSASSAALAAAIASAQASLYARGIAAVPPSTDLFTVSSTVGSPSPALKALSSIMRVIYSPDLVDAIASIRIIIVSNGALACSGPYPCSHCRHRI